MIKNFKIGHWLVEPNHNLIKNADGEVKIEPQAMAVLCYLASKQATPVSLPELIEEIWANKVVTDHVVYKTINQIRKALASDGHGLDYIKTVPKKGYALVTAVTELVEEHLVSTANSNPSKVDSFSSEQSTSNQGLWLRIKKKPLLTSTSLLVLFLVISWFSGVDKYWNKLNQKVYTKVTRLAQLDGVEYRPVLSPQGDYLLVGSQQEFMVSNKVLSVMHLAKQQVYQLTDGSYDYSNFSWSSTGRTLLASRRDSTFIGASGCVIVIIELNQAMTEIASEFELSKCSARSSSAKYDDINNIIYFDYAEKSIGPSRIFSINPDTRKTNQLTTPDISGFGDVSTELSPDRKKIAFIRISEVSASRLMLYDIETKKEQLLMELPSYYQDISWTPDSKNIVFQSSRSELSIYSLQYGFSKNIASSVGQLNEPRHSSHENSIISVYYLDSNDIFIDDNLKESTMVGGKSLVSSRGRDLFPSYSKASHQFSYNSNRGGAWQIWLADNLGNQKKLTSLTDGGFPEKTDWSPDDSQLVTAYNGKLLLIDVATGGHKVVLEKEGLIATNPIWAVDGKSLYFNGHLDDEYQIYNLNLESFEIKQITTKGGFDIATSSDGKYLYFMKYYREGLWRYSLEEGTEELVFDRANRESAGSLEAAGSGVYFIYFEDGNAFLYRYSQELGTVELVKKSYKIDLGVTISFDEQFVLWNNHRVLESSLNIHRP